MLNKQPVSLVSWTFFPLMKHWALLWPLQLCLVLQWRQLCLWCLFYTTKHLWYEPRIIYQMYAFDIDVTVFSDKVLHCLNRLIFVHKSDLPLGASQQFRAELPASSVSEALLPLLAGLHWSSISLVLSVPAGSVWDQLCTLCFLPFSQNPRSSCCFPLSPAWCWNLDEVVWSGPTERKCLPLYFCTGMNTVLVFTLSKYFITYNWYWFITLKCINFSCRLSSVPYGCPSALQCLDVIWVSKGQRSPWSVLWPLWWDSLWFWATLACWPVPASSWPFLLGNSLTTSTRPNWSPSACWYSVLSGWPLSLLMLALLGSMLSLWKFLQFWPPAMVYWSVFSPPNVSLSYWGLTKTQKNTWWLDSFSILTAKHYKKTVLQN